MQKKVDSSDKNVKDIVLKAIESSSEKFARQEKNTTFNREKEDSRNQ